MSVNTPASWSAHALEDTAGDAVWACGLARVNTFKCFTHVGCSEGEPTGFGSRPCQWHYVVLKASKEVSIQFNLKNDLSQGYPVWDNPALK